MIPHLTFRNAGKKFSFRTAIQLGFTRMCLLPMLLTVSVMAEEIYQFERSKPTLKQPWYFYGPASLAVDKNGYLIVANTLQNRVMKISADGMVLKSIGKKGAAPGDFHLPGGIAIDPDGFIYTVDQTELRIQKFNDDLEFLTTWPSPSPGPPSGTGFQYSELAVDLEGNILLADFHGNTIYKFNADGALIKQWGNSGSGQGEFNGPKGIAIDQQGFIYVSDQLNHRIQKFTPAGEFVTEWGGLGSGPGELNEPQGITVDKEGNIYVCDYGNFRVKKFSADGTHLSDWDSGLCTDVAVDDRGRVYVARGYGIRVYTTDGTYLEEWSSVLDSNEGFQSLNGVTNDDLGFFYVPDLSGRRIIKYDATGNYVTHWSADNPEGIVFRNNKLYISRLRDEVYAYNITTYTPDGALIQDWEVDAEILGFDVDEAGYIYAAVTGDISGLVKYGPDGSIVDTLPQPARYEEGAVEDVAVHGDYLYATSEREGFKKFDKDLNLLETHAAFGTGDGQFKQPKSIAVDSAGNIYISDIQRHDVQKLSPDGTYLSTIGGPGYGFGNFNFPGELAVDNGNRLFVVDEGNNRIQIFKPVTVADNSKAIIVAGGGPFAGNNLWDATQLSANFAFRTLAYQGLPKDRIYYLSDDTDLDLDGNGEADDVDGAATKANLADAIIAWAADADDLVIYLVDHGGNGTFRMRGSETLTAAELDDWIDQFQTATGARVTVIYDACESGSFLPVLTPPAGRERTIIASTSPGENAVFISQGLISFSNYFWSNIFNGAPIRDAYLLAQESLSRTVDHQNPSLDANGNGIANETADLDAVADTYLGNGTLTSGEAPVIGSVSGDQIIVNTNTASVIAENIVDPDNIARVWAVVRPPDYTQGDPGNPVQNLPGFDLLPVGNDRFEGTWDGFNAGGTYHLAIYARDQFGNTSLPELTSVSVGNPLSRKAIIIAGGETSESLWPVLEKNANLAYDALLKQGYSDEDIHYWSRATTAGVDGLAVMDNLEFDLTAWAKSQTRDVTLYLIGKGGDKTFRMNNGETLTAEQLNIWLNLLQESLPGRLTVVYDGDSSGSFIPRLTTTETEKRRILVTSTSTQNAANFLAGGDISFSWFFWKQILNGANVRDAWIQAKRAIGFAGSGQSPQLDDNGNGIPNEKEDGVEARTYTIGNGILFAGDEPLIGSIVEEQTLTGGAITATIWAGDVTTTGMIRSVWAVITPPAEWREASELIPLDPPLSPDGHYQSTYDDFSRHGVYRVSVFAEDAHGNVSLPANTTVTQTVLTGPDAFEEDDSAASAHLIVLNDTAVQRHNFYDADDVDWLKFPALTGVTYEMVAENFGDKADVRLELYDSDANTLLGSADDYFEGAIEGPDAQEIISWTAPGDRVYYLKVIQVFAGSGTETDYDLKVYRPNLPEVGIIRGLVRSDLSLAALSGAFLSTRLNEIRDGATLTDLDGNFVLIAQAGAVELTAAAELFETRTLNISLTPNATVEIEINLTPTETDTDNDGIRDNVDNCPASSNPDQIDTDLNGEGNACDSDDDGDDLPDQYEIANGLNPLDAGDAAADNDLDGLTNLQEFQFGTSVSRNDTDNDGVNDRIEIEQGRNPVINEAAVILQIINSGD